MFALRLLAPHQADVVDAVRSELRSDRGPAVDVVVAGDTVVFRGMATEASLRRRVGQALVGSLGPAGWYDYFRPLGDREDRG